MVHFRREGNLYKLGINVTFIWNKTSKSLEVSYHRFDPITETSSLVGTRIRFNMRPFILSRNYSWNRVESYLCNKSLVAVTKDFYEDVIRSMKQEKEE